MFGEPVAEDMQGFQGRVDSIGIGLKCSPGMLQVGEDQVVEPNGVKSQRAVRERGPALPTTASCSLWTTV